MPKLLDLSSRLVAESRSPVGFSTTGSGDWKVWDRFLTVNGAKAYHLGNICGTCPFFFERMEGANAGIDVGELTTRLSQGCDELYLDVVDTLAQLMPASDYVVALFKLLPEKAEVLGKTDYFAVEQLENRDWADDSPHNPNVDYYRVEGRSRIKMSSADDEAEAFDFIIPMFPEDILVEDQIKHYERIMSEGATPTAVALSLLDVKCPAGEGIEHWCFTHYLIDGHHKVAAAARAKREITLMSFIAINQGISSRDQIDAVLRSFPR